MPDALFNSGAGYRLPACPTFETRFMNNVNPGKLLNSKWTAVTPVNREKHFVVTKVEFDENGEVIYCQIEAVLTKREDSIDWAELKNEKNWLQGWK